MVSVKEYAQSVGVSIQAVYQQMTRKSNAEKLKGHIVIIEGMKYLDDEAVKILSAGRKSSPAVAENLEKYERIKELEAILDSKEEYIKVIELARIRQEEQIKNLEIKVNLIEEKKSEDIKKAVKEAEDQLAMNLQKKHTESIDKIKEHYREEVDQLQEELGTYKKTIFGFYKKVKK